MSYKTECIEAFVENLKEQNADSVNIEIAKQSFICGFDYGSLNGASEDAKKQVVETIKPIKNKRAKEIIEKLSLLKQ